MDPATLTMVTLGAQAASTVSGAMAARGQAKAERERANINAYIGRTRAIQTGAAGYRRLTSKLATLRATMRANGQTDGGVMARQIRQDIGRDIRLSVANEMTRVNDYRYEARAARSRGRQAFMMAAVQGGRSLFQMHEFSLGPQTPEFWQERYGWQRPASDGNTFSPFAR